MIVYDLQCANDHSFEGWFEDAKSFTKQIEKKFVSCPFCEDTNITKMPSTFAIKKSNPFKKITNNEKNVEAHLEQKFDLPEIDQPKNEPNEPLAQTFQNKIKYYNQLVNYIEKNFDDVGTNFAKEALKMHYGVNEPKNIRGTSTKEEEKTLKKEGIDVLTIPMPIKNNNTDA